MRRFAFLVISLISFIPTGTSYAQPAIDEKIILQICESLSDRSQMPGIVADKARADFFTMFGRLSDQLKGCLSAKQTQRDPHGVRFLVQNTRYESAWHVSFDDKTINDIRVERYRAVTLADDSPWQVAGPLDASSVLVDAMSVDVLVGASPGADRAPPADLRIVEFYYATNRTEEPAGFLALEGRPRPTTSVGGRPVFSANGWTAVSGYTGERGADLSFGAARVRVPEGHKPGNLELPGNVSIFKFWLSNSDDPTKVFTIRSIAKTDEATWIKSLSSVAPSPETRRKTAVVFVHGFNTKFRDALFRTAQIMWDLKVHATVVMFSWPSRGEVADYGYDKESAMDARDSLLQVLGDLRKAGFDEVNIIAHSMGNLAVMDALSVSSMTASPVAIAQLIMAAPDVASDMFVRDIPKVAKVTKGLTLYASANDKALRLSMRVQGGIPRAGYVPATGPIVLASLATIDVSALGEELFGLNHNTFAASENVLSDLRILLEKGTPPPRLGEIHGFPAPPEKAAYYRYVRGQ